MIFIDKGRTISEGNVSDLLNQESGIVRIQVDSPSRAKTLLEASNSSIKAIIDGEFLVVNTMQGDIPSIVDALSVSGIKIYNVTSRRTLEHLFLSLAAKA